MKWISFTPCLCVHACVFLCVCGVCACVHVCLCVRLYICLLMYVLYVYMHVCLYAVPFDHRSCDG